MAPLLLSACLALAGLASAQNHDVFPDCTKTPLSNNKVCDRSLGARARATALVAAMTQAEKIANSVDNAPGVSRLGLPAYEYWSEALHGLARGRGVKFATSGDYSYATSFPQGINLGATFDMELVKSIGEVISTEARAFSNAARTGINFWTPNINPLRDPRWGRGQEVPSEDPFVCSQYARSLVPALQGGTDGKPYWKVVATCKHYAGYDLEDSAGVTRYNFNAKITPQDLRDYYLPPFQACARDANAQSFMCAYNAINGVPTCADPWLLDTLLRKRWWGNRTVAAGAEPDTPFVVSDCDSVANAFQDHRYGSSAGDAAAKCLKAGTDLDCGDFYSKNLGAAISGRMVDVNVLDEALIRRYATKVRLGYFDPPAGQPYRQYRWQDVGTAAANALALRAAVESLVLLKNAPTGTAGKATLPLGPEVKTVAVLGPMADATVGMQGNYYGIAKKVVSPSAGFAAAGYTVVKGGSGTGDTSAIDKANAVVYVGGIDVNQETESKDRTAITWPSAQATAIKTLSAAAAKAGKPFVVVQLGTMLDSADLKSNAGVGALIWAGYPSQDGGTAMASVVKGTEAPAGRLSVTQYPAAYTGQVKITDMNLRPGSGNPGRTYKWYNGAPTFPFGHGLHYTTFKTVLAAPATSSFTTSALLAAAPLPNTQASFTDLLPFASLPVTVTNTGDVKSDMVVLAFLKGEFGPKPYPLKSLVAFTRVRGIAAGESKSATLEVSLGSVARGDEKGNLVLFPGTYSIEIEGADGVGGSWTFTITGDQKVMDDMPAK